MIDLFGLGKQPDQPPSPAPEPVPEAPAPRGSHKLWAFLLVLDSVFVIVFAGAVAAKIYQHWKTPQAAPAAAPRRRTPVAPPAPVASTATPPAPEPAKAPEPPKAAAPPNAGRPESTAPRPPKPSMLAEAPRNRETPKLADAGGKTPSKPVLGITASAPADGKVKALRTEFKVHAPNAKSVDLVGAFIVRGGRKEMERQSDGSWTAILYLNPGSYRYFFSVDKKKQLDPENPRSERGASLLTIP